jgi:hypothetical protein
MKTNHLIFITLLLTAIIPFGIVLPKIIHKLVYLKVQSHGLEKVGLI